MGSGREMATISPRLFIFTPARVIWTERAAISDFFSATDSVPPKLYNWSPAMTGRYQFQVLPDTNTWIPRNDGRFTDVSGGSPSSGLFTAMPIIGAAICPPHRVAAP